MSLTYGSDYIVTKKNTNQEFFSLKLANNLRLKKMNLEKDNQIEQKRQIFWRNEIQPFKLSDHNIQLSVKTILQILIIKI